MNNYTVYMHRTPNNKYYIGITKQSVEERWKNRLGYITQTIFWRAIEKYGWDNIEHIIVAEHLTHDEACAKEIELIAQYKSNNPKYGYNRTSGGDGTSNFSHKNPHSYEWCKKVSIANTGKKRTDEAKQKMRKAKLGTHWPDERKKQYSQSQKARGFRPSDKCFEASREARSIKIYQYDLDGNLIASYQSMTEAAKQLNISISYMSMLCANKRKAKNSLKKFIFIRKGE